MNNPKGKKQENAMATLFIVLSLLIIGSVLTVNAVANKRQSANQPQTSTQEPVSEGKLDLNDIVNQPDGETKPTTNTTDPAKETQSDAEEQAAGGESTATASGATVDLSKMKYPVSSKEVTMQFSLNSAPVFSKTFNEYRSDHNGVDFKASQGEEVKAAMDGKVVEILTDPRLGTTIKIEHENKVYTEYSNLAADVKVKLNDTVKAGQSIAKVGATALYEISDGDHLHFALFIKDAYVDPMKYLK